MTETRPMQLHLGKCIEDLDELHNVPDLKSKRATLLCKTAQKLFEKAEEAREKGDEEYSYVYYMKYLRVVAYLSKDKEYMKDKAYFKNMLGVKNPNKAIDNAEKLKQSLIERYEMERQMRAMEEDQARAAEQQAQQAQQAQQNLQGEKGEQGATAVGDPVSLPSLDEVMIKCDELYPILKSGAFRVMILDARATADFQESHLNYGNCISVPEEVISPGKSAHVLEQNLPPESRKVWAERAGMDLIVMIDWNSTALIPGSTLFLLKTILLRWDVKVHYSRPPLALWGGYEEWLLRYPALTTNPQVLPPGQVQAIDNMLDDVNYPNWGDVMPPLPAPETSAERVPGRRVPVVDRSSKAAAVQIYSERARYMQRLLDQQERIADNSITLEMQRIEAEKDWRRVYVQGESEQRQDVLAVYQLREQEISSQLMQLENKQYDMEQENKQLRERLEAYMRRDREEAERIADMIAERVDGFDRETLIKEQAAVSRDAEEKRRRIEAMEQQRLELDRQRELLEAERKNKLAEARKQKKPDLHKDEEGDVYMASPTEVPSSGNLSRSESTPSLKRLGDEEEDLRPPPFDRNTKPTRVAPSNDHRLRDFEPVWGNVEGRGLTGLKNLGNTCYMNSIIQCLNNTACLVPYFCTGQYLQHLSDTPASCGRIADELAAVVRALWSGEYRFIAIKDLRNELAKQQRTFRNNEQQDSHEFLTILMDCLHRDLQYSVHPRMSDFSHEGLSPSEKAWHQFTKCKESVILRLFYGQIRSTVKCSVCSQQSVTYETFSNLSLEMPLHVNRCTLSDCLNMYLNNEKISGWNCPQCKQKRDATKKLDIARLPPILVIHFKRFFVDPNAQKVTYLKRQTYIDFPLSGLNLRAVALSAGSAPLYDLYAVSNHYGSIECGHYTASCKSSTYGKWYKYDDHQVTEMSASDVKSSAAYILFYARRGQ